MLRRLLPLLLALSATPAGAQIIRMPAGRDPAVWVSGAAGLFQAQGVEDGRTGTAWAFGDGFQLRGALEWGMRNESSFGVTGSWARLPLRYIDRGTLGAPGIPASCSTGCDAHATVWSLAGSFHAGGGQGFHQVIEITAGVIGYSAFEADDGGAELPPLGGDRDVALSLGYGFGFPLGPRLHVTLVQDFGISLHQDEGLSGGQSRTQQQRTTRLGVRYGLGTRAPR